MQVVVMRDTKYSEHVDIRQAVDFDPFVEMVNFATISPGAVHPGY